MLGIRFQLCFLAILPSFIPAEKTKKVVCFYDSLSHRAAENGQFSMADLEPALGTCTHLIYTHGIIDENNEFKGKELKPYPSLNEGDVFLTKITDLKKTFPKLYVLVSVGGWADHEIVDEKHMISLTHKTHQTVFVSSAQSLIKNFGFDGIDLAWHFKSISSPMNETTNSTSEAEERFSLSSEIEDDEDFLEEQKAYFVTLVQLMRMELKPQGFLVTVSVFPSKNYTYYINPKDFSEYVDGIHLLAFDFVTAQSKTSPETADYPAPLYSTSNRSPEFSADYMVSWFVNNSMPADKVILGIPAFARTWRLTSKIPSSGTPPLKANGEGMKGNLTNTTGLLSYPEVCSLLRPSDETKYLLTKVKDASKNLGTYAYREENDEFEGIWVGYDDLEIVTNKAAYARDKGLGGIAIVDLTMDDYGGTCSGDKYPLLKAAAKSLQG